MKILFKEIIFIFIRDGICLDVDIYCFDVVGEFLVILMW